MTPRFQARYRGDWILVVDTATNKVLDRFYGWDDGWPAAAHLLDSLNR